MGGFLRSMNLKSLTSFWGCIRLPTGVKWCKSGLVKNKLTPTLTSLWSVKGGKMM